jgi:predicted DNA-binding protein
MTTPTTEQVGKEVKDRYMTIRIPFDIDQELRKLADANTRTLASQVLHYIKQGMANEKTPAL